MAFDKPQSRNEAILQNMLGANNELEPPKSRVEALLQDIAGQMPEANPSEGTTTGTLERLKIGDDIYTVEGGGSGTSDYDALNNKPQIAGVTLSGDKSLADLGIASATAVSGILDGTDIDSFGDVEAALGDKVDKVDGKGLSSNDFTDAYKTAIGDNTTAISGIKNGEGINSFGGVESALALKQNATDNSLDTEAKTIVGAINEHEGDISSLKSGLTDLTDHVDGDATTYPYADVITINDAVPANLADCSVKVELVQDLHGQSAPYVGGAGKQKLPLDLATLKTLNTSGTWADNVYTLNDVTATCNLDDGGNVVSIKTNGTASATFFFLLGNFADILTSGTSYIINSNIYPTSDSAYLQIRKANDAGYLTLTGEYSFEYASDGNVQKFGIRVDNAETANNVVLTPMLRLATETDATFAPYTNLCPIEGHTEVDVQRDGKNLCDWKVDIATNALEIALKSGTYTISAKSELSDGNWYFRLSDANGEYSYTPSEFGNSDFLKAQSGWFYGGSWLQKITFIVPLGCSKVEIAKLKADGTIPAQLELGSTATPYVPYAGKTYTIALGDTIYGGTVDFDSGVMTVDRAVFDLSTISDWSVLGDGRLTSNKLQNVVKAPEQTEVNVLCETYKPCSSRSLADDSTLVGIGINSGKLIVVRTPDGNAPQGGKLCYVLNTPTTIQLTPTQIQLLKGQNTLYASTGDISVTVNGVSGAIGQVQEQVNATDAVLAELAADIAEQLPDAPTTDGAYVLTVTVADGTPTYSWESAT